MKKQLQNAQKNNRAARLFQIADADLFSKNWEGAIQKYQRALKTSPKNSAAWANLGAALLEVGEAEKAEIALERARTLDPKGINVLGNFANLKKQLGDNQASEKVYRELLNHHPTAARAWNEMARVKRFYVGDPDIPALESLHAKSGRNHEARMHAAFALGKALEETGDYDRAFEYIKEANFLKRQTFSFDIKDYQIAIDEIIRVFDASFINRFQSCGNSDGRPIFILGMPRSGTTLVEQILASHNSVFGCGEFEGMNKIVKASISKFPKGAALLAPENFNLIGKKYVDLLTQYAGAAKRVTDKMPRNFLFIGLILTILPQARIVHCQRSPMDTCFSCYALHFPRGQEFSYNMVELGNYYVLYRRLMEHWHRVAPGQILDINYEDVILDTEVTTRELIDFCGLDWDKSCLEFHKTKRLISTASATQVREPIHSRSMERWRRFEEQLQPLKNIIDG